MYMHFFFSETNLLLRFIHFLSLALALQHHNNNQTTLNPRKKKPSITNPDNISKARGAANYISFPTNPISCPAPPPPPPEPPPSNPRSCPAPPPPEPPPSNKPAMPLPPEPAPPEELLRRFMAVLAAEETASCLVPCWTLPWAECWSKRVAAWAIAWPMKALLVTPPIPGVRT